MRPLRDLLPVIAMFSLLACQEEPPSTSSTSAASVVDFGNFLASCAAGNPKAKLRRRDYWDYGCYSGKGGKGTPVDATDTCAQTHDACWAKVKTDTGVSCFGENYANNYNDPATGKPTDDCSKWTFAESCSKAKHPGNDKPEEEQCCACDLAAVQCFQAARPTYNPKYKNWSDNGNPGARCGPTKGKSFTCASGYIKRGEACTSGTKVGNRAIGYWCETTCNKPDACETSAAVGNAYARCAAPPAVAQTCGGPTPIVARTAVTVDAIVTDAPEGPCVGAECDECPHCSSKTCGGNHAPEEPDLDNDDLPDGWNDEGLLPDPDADLEIVDVSPA